MHYVIVIILLLPVFYIFPRFFNCKFTVNNTRKHLKKRVFENIIKKKQSNTTGRIKERKMFGIIKYKVDYCGKKQFFKRAKDAYRAGKTVVLYYGNIGTDADYSFYLDNERLNVTYSSHSGYKIKFKMPARDIKLCCKASSSMNFAEADTADEK